MRLRRLIVFLVATAAISNVGGSPASAAGAPTPTAPLRPSDQPVVIPRGAISGVRQRISFLYEVNPDCSSEGLPAIHTLSPPHHGKLETVGGEKFPSFPATSQSIECNLHTAPGIVVYYTGATGFQGEDSTTLSVIYPDGYRYVVRYEITVDSAG